jgi:hypothetical protein
MRRSRYPLPSAAAWLWFDEDTRRIWRGVYWRMMGDILRIRLGLL